MSTQREHIARLAETLTTATIAVVPFAAQSPIAVLHGWLLTDDIAITETYTGNLEVADPQHVDQYWEYTRLLLDIAATGEQTAAICRPSTTNTPRQPNSTRVRPSVADQTPDDLSCES